MIRREYRDLWKSVNVCELDFDTERDKILPLKFRSIPAMVFAYGESGRLQYWTCSNSNWKQFLDRVRSKVQ